MFLHVDVLLSDSLVSVIGWSQQLSEDFAWRQGSEPLELLFDKIIADGDWKPNTLQPKTSRWAHLAQGKLSLIQILCLIRNKE